MDPETGTLEDVGYTICRTTGGRIQVDAPDAENRVVSVRR